MNKKLYSLFAILVALALVLAACDRVGGGEPYQVGFVTDTGGIDDKSFNTTQWAGVVRAQEDLGIESKYIQSDEATQYEPNLTEFASQGYDLVIAAGFFLGGDLAKVAAQYPDVQFSIVDYAYPDPFGVPEGVVGNKECIPRDAKWIGISIIHLASLRVWSAIKNASPTCKDRFSKLTRRLSWQVTWQQG